jgi:Neurotransmitter-gated ion-channel ligand binding domain
VFCAAAQGNPDAKRLYDDLLSNYNKLVRPVANVSDALEVKIKLKLSQLIDVVIMSDLISVMLLRPRNRVVCYHLLSSLVGNRRYRSIL